MGRYVEIDKALNEFRECVKADNCNDIEKHMLYKVVEVIDKLFEVYAEPIVCCKDCKYFMDGNGCHLLGVDYTWEEQMDADDFCSRGERKDE